MKKKLFTMALLGALAGFSSCSEEEELTSLAPTQKDIQINAEIVGYEDPTHARTVIDNEGKVKWEEGDVLQIGYTSDSRLNDGYNTSIKYQSGKFQELTDNRFAGYPGEKHYILATNINSEELIFLTSIDGTYFSNFNAMNLPTAIQDENLPGKGIGKRDMLSGFTTMIPTGQGDVINLKMKHLLSLLKFNIKNETGQPFTVNALKLQVPENTIIDGKLCPSYVTDETGNFVLYEKKVYGRNNDGQRNFISVTVKNAPETANGTGYEVSALTFPFKLTKDDQIEITVVTNAGEFKQTYQVKNNLDFKASALSTATVVVNQLDSYNENNVYIPDPNFHRFLIQNYDNDHNNKLSKSELLGIKKLELNYEGICSLKGIENLENLDFLTIIETNPIEADLTKNTSLTTLNFYGDTQASNLNIKGLKSLKSIYICSSKMKQPLIKGIDFTEFINLEIFQLENLDLSSLNLTGLNKLKELYLIDMPNLALENIQVNKDIEQLAISTEAATSINVSAFTHLKFLKMTNTHNLTQLNLSGCTELTDLDIESSEKLKNVDLSAATQLMWLRVWSSGLTGINLSQCKELTYVELTDNNNLGTLDMSGHSKLKKLNAVRCNLTSLKLSGCSMLSYLDADTNNLTELDVSECHHNLGKDFTKLFFISGNPNLKTLYVWKGFEIRDGCYFPEGLKPTVKK